MKKGERVYFSDAGPGHHSWDMNHYFEVNRWTWVRHPVCWWRLRNSAAYAQAKATTKRWGSW